MMTFSLKWLTVAFIVITTAPNWKAEAQAVVNGNWSEWSVFKTPCNQTCGGGYKVTMRSCSNPVPQGGGSNCTKLDNTVGIVEYSMILCNPETCFNGTYSNWTYCDNCTVGYSYREAMCGNYTCNGTQYSLQNQTCNRWNKTICPSPCNNVTCPDYALCVDTSNDTYPSTKCECTMGYIMSTDKKSCLRPPPTMPPSRPIPTLPPVQKIVATVMSKSASTVLIVFVSLTLILFIMFRIFTVHRVIQMNMEIALLIAHLFLLIPPTTTYNYPTICSLVSLCNHFFFTAAFIFMMLEALHMYSLVSQVVRRDGFFNRTQNTIIGWGLAFFIVLICLCFEWQNYGGAYHCWLQMDTSLCAGELLPVFIIVIIGVTLIEAAGAIDFKPLKGIDSDQLLSAKISQRTNLLIIFFVFAHWIVGMLSEYEQNMALYSVFSILNSISGGLIFFLHCSCSEKVRSTIWSVLGKVCKCCKRKAGK